MSSLFEKVRYALFGERDVTEKADIIVNDKKLDGNIKVAKIFSIYAKYYYLNDHENTAKSICYELYYENFMLENGTVHGLRYESCLSSCKQEINLCNEIKLAEQLAAIRFDMSKCTSDEIKIICKIIDNKETNRDIDMSKVNTYPALHKELFDNNKKLFDLIVDNYTKHNPVLFKLNDNKNDDSFER